MGSSVSSPAPPDSQKRKSGAGGSSKRRSSTGSSSGSAAKRSRKSSTGGSRKLSVRKSLVDPAVAAADLVAFHEDIDKDLPDEERLQTLFSEAFSHAMRGMAESDTSNPDEHKDIVEAGEALVKEYLGELEKDGLFEEAVEEADLKPNPMNEEMADSIRCYKNTQARLKAEEKEWEAALARAEEETSSSVEPLPAPSTNNLAEADAKFLEDSAARAAAKQAERGMQRVNLQIEKLEQFVDVIGKGSERLRTYYHQQSGILGENVDAKHPGANKPRKLLQSLAAKSP